MREKQTNVTEEILPYFCKKNERNLIPKIIQKWGVILYTGVTFDYFFYNTTKISFNIYLYNLNNL